MTKSQLHKIVNNFLSPSLYQQQQQNQPQQEPAHSGENENQNLWAGEMV